MSDPRPCEYFTLVFKGDIRKFKANPLTTETPFGTAIVAGIGNAFEELDVAREECAKIAEAIDSGRGNEKEIARAIRARV